MELRRSVSTFLENSRRDPTNDTLYGSAHIALGSHYQRYLTLLGVAFVAMLLQWTPLFLVATAGLIATGIWGFCTDQGFTRRGWAATADTLVVGQTRYPLLPGDVVRIHKHTTVSGGEQTTLNRVWRLEVGPAGGARLQLLFADREEAQEVRRAVLHQLRENAAGA